MSFPLERRLNATFVAALPDSLDGDKSYLEIFGDLLVRKPFVGFCSPFTSKTPGEYIDLGRATGTPESAASVVGVDIDKDDLGHGQGYHIHYEIAQTGTILLTWVRTG